MSANDRTGQSAVQAPAVSGLRRSFPGSSNRVQWNPGHVGLYGGYSGASGQSNRATQYANDQAALAGNTNLTDYLLNASLIDFEPTFSSALSGAGSTYTLSAYAADFITLAGYGRGLWLKLTSYMSGTAFRVPAYFYNPSAAGYAAVNAPGYYALDPAGQKPYRASLWNTAILNRILLIYQYLAQYAQITILGTQYTGLDTCPWLRGLIIDEEVQASNIGPCVQAGGYGTTGATGWNAAGWDAGYEYLAAGIKALFPHKTIIFPYNFANTPAGVLGLSNAAGAAKCAFGGPDTLPNQTTTISGTTYNATTGLLAYDGRAGGTNWSTSLPLMMQVQQPDLPGGGEYFGPNISGSSPQYGAANYIANYIMNGAPYRASNIFWQILGTGPVGANWTGDILPWIKANPIPTLNQAYPTGYPQ